jgi:tRNA threonylcarbamoyladenosine biosynthesis protein TsaE
VLFLHQQTDVMEMNFELRQIKSVAKSFLQETENFKIFAFSGELGAGKTTFISALCEELGVTENVSSPTFSIIQEYETQAGKAVYHIDLYRIKSKAEAVEAGIEDCIYSGETCFVEWPERAPSLFPEKTVFVTLEVQSLNSRKLIVQLPS